MVHKKLATQGPDAPSYLVPLACLNQDPSCSQVWAQLSKDWEPFQPVSATGQLHWLQIGSMTYEEKALHGMVVVPPPGPSVRTLGIGKTSHNKRFAMAGTRKGL